MTGEMSWIKPNGDDSNGECWAVHAAVARAVKGELRAFDVYQGPYIKVKQGQLWISSEDGFTGTVCLLQGGPVCWGGTATTEDYAPYDNIRRACRAARAVLKRTQG